MRQVELIAAAFAFLVFDCSSTLAQARNARRARWCRIYADVRLRRERTAASCISSCVPLHGRLCAFIGLGRSDPAVGATDGGELSGALPYVSKLRQSALSGAAR